VVVSNADEAAQLIRECDSRLQTFGARFSYPTYVTAHDGLAVHLRSEQQILASDDETITVTGEPPVFTPPPLVVPPVIGIALSEIA